MHENTGFILKNFTSFTKKAGGGRRRPIHISELSSLLLILNEMLGHNKNTICDERRRRRQAILFKFRFLFFLKDDINIGFKP